MQEIFYGQGYQEEFLVSSKSNKQFWNKDLELQHLVKSIENIETEFMGFGHKPFNSNISEDEQEKALQKLVTNKDNIIKPTDKGGALAVMDKTYYCDHVVNKEHLLSNVYKEVPLDSDKQETLRVVTIGMICSTLASFWKFQYHKIRVIRCSLYISSAPQPAPRIYASPKYVTQSTSRI